MKRIFLFLAALLIAVSFGAEAASRYQRGYAKRNGTYVSGHYKTRSDSFRSNNYSTRGNINPYTGKRGTKDPYSYRQSRRH